MFCYIVYANDVCLDEKAISALMSNLYQSLISTSMIIKKAAHNNRDSPTVMCNY